MMMTPERLDAMRADVEDVEKRADRIETWRAMPHRFAVESGLRTQGLRAPRLAAHLRDLLAEVERLQDDLSVAQSEAWQCQECFAVHPLSRRPIYGEYPDEGDVFCSEDCLRANDARGDEACDPGVQP